MTDIPASLASEATFITEPTFAAHNLRKRLNAAMSVMFRNRRTSRSTYVCRYDVKYSFAVTFLS